MSGVRGRHRQLPLEVRFQSVIEIEHYPFPLQEYGRRCVRFTFAQMCNRPMFFPFQAYPVQAAQESRENGQHYALHIWGNMNQSHGDVVFKSGNYSTGDGRGVVVLGAKNPVDDKICQVN